MFIYDNTALPNWPKTNFGLRPDVPATQKVSAGDWNATDQALVDVQTFCRGANWMGFTKQAGDPAPAGIADYLWIRTSDGALMHNAAQVGGGGGGGGSPAVAISHATSSGTKNLSTEGTIDWLSLTNFNGNTIARTNGTAGGIHAKLTGGWIWAALSPVWAGSVTSSGSAGFTTQISTTLADDLAGTVITNNTNGPIQTSVSGTGWGWVFRVPAELGVQRTCRFILNSGSGTMTVTAKLSISGTTATDSQSGTVENHFDIPFTGGVAGDELVVTVLCTVNGTNCAAGLTAITLFH